MDVKCGKTIRTISAIIVAVLLFFTTLIGCSYQGEEANNDYVKQPTYEEQFDDVSYNDCVYILNKNTRKFHYKDCYTIAQMSEKNKVYCDDIRESIIEHHYVPCKKCNP